MKGNWFSVFKVNIYICRGINSSILSFASVPNEGPGNLFKERIETPLREILFFQNKSNLGRALLSKEVNRKSQKMCSFVKTTQKLPVS